MLRFLVLITNMMPKKYNDEYQFLDDFNIVSLFNDDERILPTYLNASALEVSK